MTFFLSFFQSECDELTEKVQNLTAENETLRIEVHRLSDMCQKLSAENVFLYVSRFFYVFELAFLIISVVVSESFS